MNTVPVARLAALLRANAKGYYATEAATQLLIEHHTWLERTDFLAECVSCWDAHRESLGSPLWFDEDSDGPDDVAYAAINWAHIPGFLDSAPASGGEARMLALAAELAGHDTDLPLGDLLTGLDDRNGFIVIDAVRHALHLPPRTEAFQ